MGTCSPPPQPSPASGRGSAPSARRSRRLSHEDSILLDVAPEARPVRPAEIGDAAVALVELVGDLEHGEHQPALRRAGDVAAAGLAPDELARLDLEPRGRTFLVDELAFEHVGLLDLDVLVVGKNRAWRKAH